MSNNQAHPDAPNLPYYVATFKGRSVAIKRDADYQTTIKLIQKSIPKLRPADVQDIFISTTLENYGDALVQISEEIWPDVVGDVKNVEITLECDDRAASDVANVGNGNGEESAAPPAQDTQPEASSPRDTDESVNCVTSTCDSFSIFARATSGYFKLSDLGLSSKIRDIKSLIETRYHIPAALQRLFLLSELLHDAKTLDQSGIHEWTTVEVLLDARQCMIFVFRGNDGQNEPPRNIEIRCSFNRAWELAVRRPTLGVPPEDFVQTASWNVDITKNGRLFDHDLKAEWNNIFWDGISQHNIPSELTPSSTVPLAEPSPSSDWSKFFPPLSPQNSVAVSSENLNDYIQTVFDVIGFGVYSPSFTNDMLSRIFKEHFALRFISQAECETIASLSTSPTTPNMSRVLVLYKRLSPPAAKLWDSFRPTYDQGANVWKDVASVKPTHDWQHNTCFAVAEISWMEVC